MSIHVKLYLYTHKFMEGTQALLLSSIATAFYTFLEVDVMGFTGGTILVLLLFITIDFITGVSSSLRKGHVINSKQGRTTLYKLIGYSMTILLLAVLEIFIYKESGNSFGILTVSFIRHFIFFLMLLWEFHSVGENVEEMFGKKPRIFYFVEVTTKLLEERLVKSLENMLKTPEINETPSTEESTEEIQETEI